MKTIAKITILACLLLLQAGAFAQTYTSSKIARHHNGSASFFTDLPAALTASTDGDTLYLPGGTFPSVWIDKKLTIIGAGHYTDSVTATGKTIIHSIDITPSASGGSLIGVVTNSWIEFRGWDGNAITGNYTIKRCRIAFFEPYQSKLNVILEENVIDRMSTSGSPAINSFTKNIVFYSKYCNYHYSNDSYYNNIIYIDDTIPNFSNSTLSNNIFICNANTLNMYRSNTSVFEKNLFCATTGPLTISNWGNNTNKNNYTGKATSEVFVNANNFIDASVVNCEYGNSPSSTNYVYTQNYHLLSNISTTILGNDNTQVGLYGTPVPFKDGSLPFNPHISSKFIGSSVNPSGNLNVNIKVTSQDR